MSNPQAASGHQALLTIAEFASAIGKTERQIYRYIHQGRIEVITPEVSGHCGIRIPRSQLERFKSIRKPSIQIVMSDNVTSDMTQLSTPQQVPLERHEAALVRLGAVEHELEQTRKMLTDGGHQTAELTSKVHSLEIELARNEARSAMEAQLRQEAESRVQDLTLRLAQAEVKLNKRWWKLW